MQMAHMIFNRINQVYMYIMYLYVHHRKQHDTQAVAGVEPLGRAPHRGFPRQHGRCRLHGRAHRRVACVQFVAAEGVEHVNTAQQPGNGGAGNTARFGGLAAT